MSDLLDRSIIESFARLVAQAPPAGPMPIEPSLEPRTGRSARPWMLAAAAAVAVAGTAGIAVVTGRSTDQAGPAASTVAPSVSPPLAAIFPYGVTVAALSAGFEDPVDAVDAYVAAVTEPSRLPAGFNVSVDVRDPLEPRTVTPDGRLYVPISLQTPDDSGDGYVAVQRIQQGPDVWQVTAATVVGDETSNVQLADGRLTGAIATAAGGSTTLYAYDLTTGDVLDTTTVTGREAPAGGQPASVAFDLDVGAATDIGLRYWNTVAPAGGYQYVNFTDRPITSRPSARDDTAPTPSQVPATAPPTTTDPSAPTPPGPGDPTAFPILDDVPAGLTATASARRTNPEDPWTETLIGRVVEGVVIDAVAISVSATPDAINPLPGHPPSTADVFGQPASVFDYGTAPGGDPIVHVVWGTSPYFTASGTDPLAFLSAADPSTLQVPAPIDVDQAPPLTVGALPAGYEVLTPVQPRDDETFVTLSIGEDNFDLSVAPRDFLVNMAQAGPVRRIDVNGRPAWTFDSDTMNHDVAWQVDDHTYAHLKVNDGTDLDTVLALAARFDFVDWATFSGRYDLEPPTAPQGTAPGAD